MRALSCDDRSQGSASVRFFVGIPQPPSLIALFYAVHMYSFVAYTRLMEHIINVHIEQLPEGVYLATSEEVPGLVAQGRTITETLEIARDVAKKLIEAQGERMPHGPALAQTRESFDYPLILGG